MQPPELTLRDERAGRCPPAFEPPWATLAALPEVALPCAVAGGWALDLILAPKGEAWARPPSGRLFRIVTETEPEGDGLGLGDKSEVRVVAPAGRGVPPPKP